MTPDLLDTQDVDEVHAGLADGAALSADALRAKVVESLYAQGFSIDGRFIVPPSLAGKDHVRQLHETAVRHKIERSRGGLERHEPRLLARLADGADVDPERIAPRLVEVQPKSEDELLFRYAGLHWSIPVSSGYGRRLRFVVIDEHNGKLIGIIGLGDPVFALAARDQWIGWDRDAHRARLGHVMDAFVLGAVPPYSMLLCGKLIAMLATSLEVQSAFKRKYGGHTGTISERGFDGRLALVTTTSALGRSSIYNRLAYQGRKVAESVGYTRGSGEFHFANGLYADMTAFALEHCDATAKHDAWGSGFRNRREIVKKVLPKIGFSDRMLYHGIKREVYVFPLADNTRTFLAGKHKRLRPFKATADDLAQHARARWILPRARRDQRFREWNPQTWALWTDPR